jgi:hypothetical protein
MLNLSTIILIIANLFPIFGVLYLGWSLPNILYLYWAESAIIGFFNILKMATAQGGEPPKNKLFFTCFFMIHYGLFMVVHFVFLTIILLKAFEAQGLNIGLLSSIRWGLILLFLSYSSSFLANYIGKGEYKSASEKVLLLQPYGRIVVMHLTILLGTAIIWLSGPSIVLLVLLVLFKMIADLVSQLVARRNKTARG